ncbi:replication restart helicase PriA [Geofilum rubicundum]|uniref:Replication restart protein PriA n=1 Tax=Geofilum rubicundum JCM 15548 TaxID=1236989 RepID=A0A0E9LSX2_9BACT|nr:primosomal protein N' [Geofilum rubicundum]GAO28378.1 helicase PriA [Geofilum rubicundum JCM 15548]
MPQMFADIVLPVPLPKLFTYSVPEAFRSTLAKGQRVVVSFGKKKLMSGLVFGIHTQAPEAYETKPIQSVLDSQAVVTEEQLALWQWMADYYQCTIGEVYKAALPSGLKLESETRVFYNPDFEASLDLPERALALLDFLSHKKHTTIHQINEVTGLKNSYGLIKDLIELQALFVNEQLSAAFRPKTESVLSLHAEVRSEEALKTVFDQLARAPKQLQLLMTFLQQAGGVEKAVAGRLVGRTELLAAVEGAPNALNELVRKHYLTQEKREVSRLNLEDQVVIEKKSLSTEQATALQEVKNGFAEGKPVLLHGVTSSGKTELYIHLIEEVIQKGQQALYLLPEIALTTQITTRLKAHFGNDLGIYHSRFSDDERVEVWNNLLSQKSYKVILGVRSAVFLPFKHLKLIIVDEEHENSFKQYDPAPRYHARDVAMIMGKRYKAQVLLGTATPSLESYYNAKSNKFVLVQLATRFEGMQMPEIVVVNTREAQRRKMMQSHFTPQLVDYMTKALERKEQIILFQNRRGFAPYLECTACGWIPKCQHCDVSMTYHKHIHHLVCHYCGYSVPNYTTCQACESPAMQLKGFGTQKIEEDIQALFPGAGVARMDYDTTRSKKGYENIIGSFEQGKLDILVGTQMVTKGLDFDRVSLVGILNADSMLNNPDFRAFERSFQMMAQVSGRAGRKNRRGTVVLQTGDPEHPVIQFVRNNNFSGFYEQQIAEREQFKYPPFYRLIHLTIKHKNRPTVNQAANALAAHLRAVFGSRVLGPQEPPVSKIQDHHLQKIMLKLERTASPVKAKDLMQDCINRIIAHPPWRYVVVVADVDPL